MSRSFSDSLLIPADASGAYRPNPQATTKRTPDPPVTEWLLQNEGFVKSSPAKAELGAPKLRGETHLQVRRNDEVAAQSRSERDRWTFYETIRL